MNNIFKVSNLRNTLATAKDKARAAMNGEFDFNTSLNGRVLPVILPFIKDGAIKLNKVEDNSYQVDIIEVAQQKNIKYSVFGTPMCFPLEIKLQSDSDQSWWLLPTEPVITIGGNNELVQRKVAKSSINLNQRRGTIKERWSQSDYSISIDGILTSFDYWRFPEEDLIKLRRIVEAREPIHVKCLLFEIFGIGRMIIEKYDFPFTKGEENQAYKISGYSDNNWDLLIKLNAK